MPAQPIPAEPTHAPAQAPAHAHAKPHEDADLAQDLELLREIAELGADALRHLHAEIAAQRTAEPEHREPTAAAVERLIRAVRRTIHLRQHLRQNAANATAAKNATRTQIIRQVESAITRATTTQATTTRPRSPETEPDDLAAECRTDVTAELRAQMHDRLETLEFEHDLQTRPAAEILADILEDLGLPPSNATPSTPKPPRPRPPPHPNSQPGGSLLENLLRKR